MKTITEMMKEAYETNLSKGFYGPRYVSVGEAIALAHSELSEALESDRKGEKPYWYGENGKPEGMAAEYADVIIRLMSDAQYRQLPLEQAIEEKMAYNKTRPLRHGGRRY